MPKGADEITMRAERPLPARLRALDDSDLDPTKQYTVARVCDLDLYGRETGQMKGIEKLCRRLEALEPMLKTDGQKAKLREQVAALRGLEKNETPFSVRFEEPVNGDSPRAMLTLDFGEFTECLDVIIDALEELMRDVELGASSAT